MSPAQPVVGVLAMQGDVREHLVALAECGVLARPVRRPEELAQVHGLVLPGGESTTMSRLLETSCEALHGAAGRYLRPERASVLGWSLPRS